MAKRELPDPELLRKLLRYEPETGNLYWKPRTPDMFTDSQKTAEHQCNNWNSRYAGKPAFTADNGHGYPYGTVCKHKLVAHRVIWAIVTGSWPTKQIDHINGDRTDNRFENIRDVSRSENLRNMALPKSNTSGVMGVHWFKNAKRWSANIRVSGKSKHLGYFDTKEEAAKARAIAERKYGYHPNHGRHSAATGGASSSSDASSSGSS